MQEKKIGLIACGSKNKKELEAWCKKILKTIDEVRKHMNILQRHQRKEIRRKGKFQQLEGKYNIKKKKRIKTVIEMLKQQLRAKTIKLKKMKGE